MKSIRVKELIIQNSKIAVINKGVGPISGGLWNIAIKVEDKIFLSSTGKFCVGGVSVQKLDEKTGLYGKKTFIDLPGGEIAWWPKGGFFTYENAWGTGYFHPVDDEYIPIPGASYPALTQVGMPGFPQRPGRNLAIGDITGNGNLDIVLSLKDWTQDGYFPDKHRWRNKNYEPYSQRNDNDQGKAADRDETLPFWGSKRLAPFQEKAVVDPDTNHFKLKCDQLFGGDAKKDILTSVLPRDGPWEFSLQRTYRGNAPFACYAVFEGSGKETLPNLDEEEPGFNYIGNCVLKDGSPIKTFADGSMAILPGGDLVTIDFVGEIQYFKKIDQGLIYKEMPVNVENGYIPAIHGCIGTVTLEYRGNGEPTDYLLFSGEFGITQRVKYKQKEDGLWIEAPDENTVQAYNDFYKEDILVVPSFLDTQTVILGSGSGRYSAAKLKFGDDKASMERIQPYSRLRMQAGPVGSVQGTSEERWGYTCPTVFDLNGDGEKIVISGDISEYIWKITRDNQRTVLRYNNGTPARVAWRVRPAVFSVDGSNYIVTVNQESDYAVFSLNGTTLDEIGTISHQDGTLFGSRKYGGSKGRLKFEAIQGEGQIPDLLLGTCSGVDLGSYTTEKAIVARLISKGSIDDWMIPEVKLLGIPTEDDDFKLITFGHHSCAPALIPEDWDGRSPKKGESIVVGAEDGRLYYFKDPRYFKI